MPTPAPEQSTISMNDLHAIIDSLSGAGTEFHVSVVDAPGGTPTKVYAITEVFVDRRLGLMSLVVDTTKPGGK